VTGSIRASARLGVLLILLLGGCEASDSATEASPSAETGQQASDWPGDVEAQANAHLANAAALVALLDGGPPAITPASLASIEPGLKFVTTAARRAGEVNIAVADRELGIAAMSETGSCFWLVDPLEGGESRYGQGLPCTGRSALNASESAW
jgi:hypothetical protein